MAAWYSAAMRVANMVWGTVVLFACGDSAVDTNKPETFWDTCSEDASVCQEPFECLSVEQLQVCTMKCSETSECPRWEATGHCAGDFQSRCLDGICSYGCE
jgi:hypothetical protein